MRILSESSCNSNNNAVTAEICTQIFFEHFCKAGKEKKIRWKVKESCKEAGKISQSPNRKLTVAANLAAFLYSFLHYPHTIGEQSQQSAQAQRAPSNRWSALECLLPCWLSSCCLNAWLINKHGIQLKLWVQRWYMAMWHDRFS